MVVVQFVVRVKAEQQVLLQQVVVAPEVDLAEGLVIGMLWEAAVVQFHRVVCVCLQIV